MNIQYEQQQQKKRKRKEKNFKLGLYVCMCVCVCVPFWFHDIRTNDDVILNKKVINNRIVYNGMNMNNEWIHFDINFFKYQNPVLTITIPLFFFIPTYFRYDWLWQIGFDNLFCVKEIQKKNIHYSILIEFSFSKRFFICCACSLF